MNRAGIIASIFSIIGIFLQFRMAYADSFATVSQMKRKGFARGVPIFAHLGIWGDLLVVTPILGLVVSKYSDVWILRNIVVTAAISFCIGYLAMLAWEKSPLPEALTYDSRRSDAGLVHTIYTGAALSVLILLYFATPHQMIDPVFIKRVSILLTLHFFFGTHAILKIWNPEWFGIPFKVHDFIPAAVVAILLGWRTYAILAAR